MPPVQGDNFAMITNRLALVTHNAKNAERCMNLSACEAPFYREDTSLAVMVREGDTKTVPT